MARRIVCPNCGADHELVNPGIVMLVCEHCHTSIYLSDEAIEDMGRQSLLAEDDSRLQLGATGRVAGRGFTTKGHVRYRYPDGFWDEWYLELEDGRTAWLIEDGRRLSLQTLARRKGVPPPGRLVTNQPAIKVAQVTYLTRSTGQATCDGGAGQLPYTVEPGERLSWADLASLDGKRVGAIARVGQKSPWLFTGVALPQERLQVNLPADGALEPSCEARDVDCPHCGAPLPRTAARDVETLVCAYCGAQADLSEGRAKVLGVNPDGFDPGFCLEIGQAGRLDSLRWEVCGRVLRTIGQDRDEHEVREYLLYNPTREARWLFEQDGHFVLASQAAQAPVLDPLVLAEPRKQVPVGLDEVYRFARAGGGRVQWVDGALPHRVAVGDMHAWAELVDPPRDFLVKASGPEMICYAGTYLPAGTVWEAFSLPPPPPVPRGVLPCQPFRPGPLFTGLLWTGIAFALLNLLLFAGAWMNEGDEAQRRLVDPVDYRMGDVVLPSLEMEGPGVLGVRLSAPLDEDDRLEVVFALADERDRVVVQDRVVLLDPSKSRGLAGLFGKRATDVSLRLRVPGPGRYRPLIRAGGGRSVQSLTVVLTTGLWRAAPFGWAFALAALLPLGALLVYRSFDSRRWPGVLAGGEDALDDRLAEVFAQARSVGHKQIRKTHVEAGRKPGGGAGGFGG